MFSCSDYEIFLCLPSGAVVLGFWLVCFGWLSVLVRSLVVDFPS